MKANGGELHEERIKKGWHVIVLTKSLATKVDPRTCI